MADSHLAWRNNGLSGGRGGIGMAMSRQQTAESEAMFGRATTAGTG